MIKNIGWWDTVMYKPHHSCHAIDAFHFVQHILRATDDYVLPTS